MSTDPGMTTEATHPRPVGNLAPVALATGLAGALLGIVPFYGIFLGVPLSVTGVVLGLVARSRAWESRGQALGGIVGGIVGLLLTAVWTSSMLWTSSGFGQFASETGMEVDVGSGGVIEIEAGRAPGSDDLEDRDPDHRPDGSGAAAPDASATEVRPTDPGTHLLTGLRGEATAVVDGTSRSLTLTDCALPQGRSRGALVRGEGDDGRVVVAQPDGFGQVVVDLEFGDERIGPLLGQVQGSSRSSRSGGWLVERHRFELDGQLRHLHDDSTVRVTLEVSCE